MPLMKRSAWAASILSLSLLHSAGLKVDHATVGGQKLAPLEEQLDKLGIRWEYGGLHANHITEMAVASFPDGSYVELIAFQPNADPAAASKYYWAKYMQGNAGPCAWAVRSTDVDAEAKRLRDAGIKVSEPRHSGRTRPDGFELKWETAQVGTEGNGVFFPFLIRDLTPREKRAFPSGKPTNPDWVGIAQIEIAVKNEKASRTRFYKTYGMTHTTVVNFRKDPARVAKFGEGVAGIGVEKADHTTVWIR